MSGIVDQAHDVLVTDAVFEMYDAARDAWAVLAEELLDPDETEDVIRVLMDVNARFEAMLPAIRDRGTRRLDELEWLRAIGRGEIDPPPDESWSRP